MAQIHDKLVPTNDFVLLEEEPVVSYQEYKGYHHLVLPDKYLYGPEDRAIIGVVRGKGHRCSNPEIQLGHRIVIGKWDGARFPRNGKSWILVKEEDVLATLT